MLRLTTRWQPDIAALRSASTRIVVGIGEYSTGQLCDRTSRALAVALGIAPTMFSGGHIGFADDPDGSLSGFAPSFRSAEHGAGPPTPVDPLSEAQFSVSTGRAVSRPSQATDIGSQPVVDRQPAISQPVSPTF